MASEEAAMSVVWKTALVRVAAEKSKSFGASTESESGEFWLVGLPLDMKFTTSVC